MAIKDLLRRMIGQFDTGFSDLNTSRIDGENAGISEVMEQLSMLPLGGGKRLVIVENAGELLGREGAKEWIEVLLGNFPPAALLVLILQDEKRYRKGEMIWNTFKGNHWFRKTASKHKHQTFWKEVLLPSEKEMPAWIIEKAEHLGGKFQSGAAVVLTGMVGNDLYQAQHEIEKAVAYVNEGEEVTADDIRLLCASSKEEDIFALVDAVGQKKKEQVFHLLRKLSVNSPVEYIFTMLTRQIRMLILTKETLVAQGGEREIMSACNVRYPFIAKKLAGQSRRFELQELKRVYRELNRIDESVKIGRSSLEAEIDTLIAKIVL